MRNNLIPSKLGIFIWRAKLKRLPVLIELEKRGIDLNSVRFPTCDDGIESIDHSLVLCKHAFEVWDRVCKWWNLDTVNIFSVDDLFCGKHPKIKSSWSLKLWQAIEWICGYYIWKNRNQKIFKKKWWSGSVILNEIQIKSFEWISIRSRKKQWDWNQWLVNPSVYLDNG
ncbi:uncharacterized protein [Rutidosis leptorrhynchoides]|uniref:uncharacterized protein n=1 Tax=Rutidosis leptorrhynchoides TaxID=125765 RepID=UPI003A997974